MGGDKDKINAITPVNELEEQLLLAETNSDIKQIIDIFNLNLKKRDIIRASKLEDLQDLISDQMKLRLEKRAGEFSNKDLVDYFKVINDTLSRTNTDSSSVPQIQVNQNTQVNITDSIISNKDSRDKILDAIRATIHKMEEQTKIIDVEETEINNDTGNETPERN